MSKAQNIFQGALVGFRQDRVRKFSRREPFVVQLTPGEYVFFVEVHGRNYDHVLDANMRIVGRPDLSFGHLSVSGKTPFAVEFRVETMDRLEWTFQGRLIVHHTSFFSGVIGRTEARQHSWDDIFSLFRLERYVARGEDINAFIQSNRLGDISKYLLNPTQLHYRTSMWEALSRYEEESFGATPGLTFLHCAAWAGNVAAVDFLLRSGANVSILTQKNRLTALDLARYNHAPQGVIDLLTGRFSMGSGGGGPNPLNEFLNSVSPGLNNLFNRAFGQSFQGDFSTANVSSSNNGGSTFAFATATTSLPTMSTTRTSTYTPSVSATQGGSIQINFPTGASITVDPRNQRQQQTAMTSTMASEVITHQSNQYYTVVFPFQGSSPSELTVAKMQRVKVLEPADGMGWIKCQVESTVGSSIGFVPHWCLSATPWTDKNSGPKKENETQYAGQQFRVIAEYKSAGPGELTVKTGEILIAMESPTNDGWIKVKQSRPFFQGTNSTAIGYVPASYLRRNVEMPSASSLLSKAHSQTTQTTASASLATVVPPPPPREASLECPICFEEMHLNPVAIFLSSRTKKRTCRHFLHYECAVALSESESTKTCPHCRVRFDRVEKLADFDTNPRAWFNAVDFAGNGELSKQEVLDAFKALLAIDNHALEEDVERLWPQWTGSRNADITFDQLCSKGGLLAYVRREFALFDLRKEGAVIPPLEESQASKLKWFRFFDDNVTGELSLEELCRAISRTYCLGAQPYRVEQVRNVLQAVWPFFCGDENDACDEQTFIQDGGLGDSLIASFASLSIRGSSDRSLLGRSLLRQSMEM